MAQTMSQTHGASGPMHSLQHHDGLSNGSNIPIYPNENPQQSEELFKRSVMIVIWYKAHTTPLRLLHPLSSFPFLQLSCFPSLLSSLSLSQNSWVDAYNAATGQWEQHMIDTVRYVQSEERILYRLRRSLLEGLSEEECPDIEDEVAMQPPPVARRHPHRPANGNGGSPHGSVSHNGGTNGLKRPAPDSADDSTGPAQKYFVSEYRSGHAGTQPQQQQQQYAVPMAQNYPQTLSTPQQPHSSPIQASNGVPQNGSTMSSPSNNSQQSQHHQQQSTPLKQGTYVFQQGGMYPVPPQAPMSNTSAGANQPNINISPHQTHSQTGQTSPQHHHQQPQQHQQQPQHQQHQAHEQSQQSQPDQQPQTAELPDHIRNPLPAPAPIPYHPHPPLKRWPNDYTVSEISIGFKQMDSLVGSMPTLTQRVAFERVFGCRYVKSTVCRHRGVWRRAGEEVRAYFEGLGRDERAVWGEFVRKVEGRASGLQGGGENGGMDGSSGAGTSGQSASTGMLTNGHGVVGPGVGMGISVGIPLGQSTEDMVHMQGGMMLPHNHGHNHNQNHGHNRLHSSHMMGQRRDEGGQQEEEAVMGSLGPPPPEHDGRTSGVVMNGGSAGAQNGEVPTQTHTPMPQPGGNPHVQVYDPSLTNALGNNE